VLFGDLGADLAFVAFLADLEELLGEEEGGAGVGVFVHVGGGDADEGHAVD
jgi:hypothetical protein